MPEGPASSRTALIENLETSMPQTPLPMVCPFSPPGGGVKKRNSRTGKTARREVFGAQGAAGEGRGRRGIVTSGKFLTQGRPDRAPSGAPSADLVPSA